MADSGPAVASASKAMEGITLASSTSTPVPGPSSELHPQIPAPTYVASGLGGDSAMADGTIGGGGGLPEGACETLYIQNLNETVKIDVMKQTLRNLFKNYGPVLDVVAHRNIRMRGQAFVSFPDTETAFKALKEVKGFPLYAKPMQVTFAKSRSDAVVKRVATDEFDSHKADRLEHKKKTRWDNPHKRKARAKHNQAAEGAAPSTAPKRTAVQMPDEYLPPNKILFLQNLPESTTQSALTELFSQYPNLVEVRMVPAKKDIAFIEYADETSSGAAKDALHNYKLDGEQKIKITFARK